MPNVSGVGKSTYPSAYDWIHEKEVDKAGASWAPLDVSLDTALLT